MKVKSLLIALGMLLTASAWADGPKNDAAASINMPAINAAPLPVQKMNENLDRMRDLIGRIQQAKDPAERRQLMMQYMSTQHENMRDLMGPGMAGGGMGMMGMGMMDRLGGGPGPGMRMDEHCEQGDGHGHGMGKDGHCEHGGAKGGCMMGGRDPALMDRLHNIEKRLDALQDMIKMMQD